MLSESINSRYQYRTNGIFHGADDKPANHGNDGTPCLIDMYTAVSVLFQAPQ